MHRGVELHGCGTVPRTALGERATRSALQRLQIRAASPSRADFGSPCRLSDNARNGCARRRVPVARRATALLLLLPGPPPNKINDLDGVLAALAAVVSGSLSRIAGSRYSAARRQGSLRQPDTEQSRPARRSFLRWAGSKFRCTSSNIQVFCDEGLLSFLAAWDSRTGPKTAARRSDGALDQRPLSGKELAQNLGQLAPQQLQMSWSADSAGKRPLELVTHQQPSQDDAAPPRGLSITRWIESAVVTADAAGGIGARLALRKAEKMGSPKKGECRPRTGTDRVTKDTIRSRERCQAARTSYLRSLTPWVKGAARRLR